MASAVISSIPDFLLVLLPLALPLFLCLRFVLRHQQHQIQLLAYLGVAIAGYAATYRLVPQIKQYTLRKGIFGKDLGKRGTDRAEIPMYVHGLMSGERETRRGNFLFLDCIGRYNAVNC